MTRWEYLYVTFWVDDDEINALTINDEPVSADEAARMGLYYAASRSGSEKYGTVHALLDRLGFDEWELVTNVDSEGGYFRLIFKRPMAGQRRAASDGQQPRTGFEPGLGSQRP